MPTTNAPSLSDLQAWMKWVIMHPQGASFALKKPHALTRLCVPVIGQTAEVPREERLSIYGTAYFLRILGALASNFSAVKNTAGEKAFNQAARAYLVKFPSKYKSIDDIGAELPSFLRRRPLSKKYPFLSDLAALDWAAHRAFFADDEPAMDRKRLAGLSGRTWANAVFHLDPSTRLLDLSWPVADLWKDDGLWPARRLRSLKPERQCALVFRRSDKKVRVRILEPAQYDVLDQLDRGHTFQKALLFISKKHFSKEATPPIGAWFEQWTADGLFSRIDIPSR